MLITSISYIEAKYETERAQGAVLKVESQRLNQRNSLAGQQYAFEECVNDKAPS
jgi:hypothetical protein